MAVEKAPGSVALPRYEIPVVVGLDSVPEGEGQSFFCEGGSGFVCTGQYCETGYSCTIG
jgi:hypothetical protein